MATGKWRIGNNKRRGSGIPIGSRISHGTTRWYHGGAHKAWVAESRTGNKHMSTYIHGLEAFRVLLFYKP